MHFFEAPPLLPQMQTPMQMPTPNANTCTDAHRFLTTSPAKKSSVKKAFHRADARS
jgi:hypothetical protein